MERLSCADHSVDVAGHLDGPAVASTYAIAGRFISIDSADEESAVLFRHYFSGWHVSPVSPASCLQPDATIVVKHDEPPPPPANLQPFEVAEGGLCRTDETTYFFENRSSVVRARSSGSPRIEVWIGQNDSAREKKALARLVFNAAMTAMRRCGLYELHAAGVVAPNGEGILISGPSGSGKSTLATQLAATGWQYLSDDSLLLNEAEATVQAHALRRVFALTEDSLRAGDLKWPEVAVEPFDPLKQRFEPSVVFPNRFAEKCVPRKLFFSRITHQAVTVSRRLSRAETMTQLLRMCPWGAYDKAVAKPQLRVLEALARQAVGFELAAGRDLLADNEFAAKYLMTA